jgi:hypothetical protein
MATRRRGSKRKGWTLVVGKLTIGSLNKSTTSAVFSRIWTVKVARYMATRRCSKRERLTIVVEEER